MNNNNLSKIESWDEYLKNLNIPIVSRVRSFWQYIKYLPSSIAQPTQAGPTPDEGFMFVWIVDERYYFDLEILADGSVEWFYHDRDTEEYYGGEIDLVVV